MNDLSKVRPNLLIRFRELTALAQKVHLQWKPIGTRGRVQVDVYLWDRGWNLYLSTNDNVQLIQILGSLGLGPQDINAILERINEKPSTRVR